jgi:hypothetical protein
MKQDRKKITEALIKYFTALEYQGEKLFKFVTIIPYAAFDIRPDQFPALVIKELDDTVTHYVTSTKDIVYRASLRMIVKGNAKENQESILYLQAVNDLIIDAIATNPTLDGTALHCQSVRGDAPYDWAGDDGIVIRSTMIEIRYRRDYAPVSG